MKTMRCELDAHGIATVTFDEPDSPVNTMCQAWQDDMTALAERLRAERDAIRGVVLASAKSTFFAGADLKSVMRLTAADAPRVFAGIERLKRAFRTFETLGKPVVSCLNGAALGGGWEVALIGHHRIALDNPSIQLGLPEIKLGLMPGATGITKMVRLLGLMGARPHILDSQLFNPAEALKHGLIHELVPLGGDAADNRAALRERACAWIDTHPGTEQGARHPWDAKGYRIPGGTAAHPAMAANLTVVPAMLAQKTRGLYPAPEAALAAMVEGTLVDYDTATRIESRLLAGLMTGPVARNMVNTFFFDLNAVKSGQSRPPHAPRYQPAKVGVLGAGMMGAGIACAQAMRGIPTVLKDVSPDRAEQGKTHTARLVQARVDSGRMPAEEGARVLARIQPTDNAADLAGCDLIIEAVFEQRDLKASVTREAEPHLAPGGFLASNTSTLPISGLAAASSRPAQFIGIHFFSPVDKMPLVEIVRGAQTDDATVARAFDYALALGKTPIVVNDSRGFYTSRTFGTYVMEGITLLDEGIPAPVVEQAGLQAGMPASPLAVQDEVSLTLSLHVREQAQQDLAAEGRADTPTRADRLLDRMVHEWGRKGRAAGGGFYDYPAGAKKSLWPGLKALEKAHTSWDMAELKDRLLYRQAIETARCLAEGVLTSVHDANIGSIFGIGFPAWTGGAMQFIYGTGIDAFITRAQRLAAAHGERFALSPRVIEVIRQHRPVY